MFLHPQSVIDHLHFREGMRVADFGSGHGHFTIPTARKVGPHGRVYAIDINTDSLEQLRGEAHGEGLLQVNFIHGNIEKERGSFLSDKSIDRALLINTLFATENKNAVIKEIKRVLHPKGMFALIDWKDSFNHLGPHPEHVVTLEEALKVVLAHGFVVKKDFNAGNYHYGLLLTCMR